MWFLLSLNLSHWIGSFSTVGLDSYLGFRQKGLREAKHFTFHFWRRRDWAEREGGRARALARFPRRETAQKSRQRYGLHLMLHSFRGVRTAFNAAQFSKCTDSVQHGFWHRNRGKLCTVFEIKQGTEIEAVQLYGLLLFFCTVFKALLGTFFKILRWNLGWR